MASISTDKKTGNRRILFTGQNRKRKVIYLGNAPMKTALAIKARVESLAAAMLAGHAVDSDTAAWLGGLDRVLHEKLVAVGLATPRESATKTEKPAATLGPFLSQYIEGRTDMKGRSRAGLQQTARNLIDYFSADCDMAIITPGDADEFRIHLRQTLADNTVRRRCSRAKQFFRAAVRKKLIPENPFGDMKGCTVKAVTDRFYFITREEAFKVLEACPTAEWRLIFALARFGGLRIPSELLALRLVLNQANPERVLGICA